MSKIVFFCIPAHGHTNPTLGIVRELTGRGHEVWYYSYNSFREVIEAAGAKFIACDEYDMERRVRPEDTARIGRDIAFSTHILVETTLALDDRICKDLERLQPDCIVADSMAVWGKALALKMGIPFVSSTTTFAFNKESAKIMRQGLGDLFRMLRAMPKVNRDLKRLQDKGYPIRNILDILQNDDRTDTIVYTSAQFQPCADTFTDKYAFVGPLLREAVETVDKTREKLIYVSLGTVNNDKPRFWQNCVEAFRDTEYQVILSVGDLTNLEDWKSLPPHISMFRHVDQIAVLSRADVFITHGGMNSVSESLYYGVPLVLYPQTAEQNGVTNRVLQLGAGARLRKISPEAIREAAEAVLKGPSYRESAARISEGFKQCSGARGAADKIEQVCAQTLS
ncbi:MAG: glucosyltransferase [Clostridium sp.]|nr:glucosyltransferase [Acetatifactor muris]MCM1527514.1 hypothetical protein [Bacteroides sp.]MCM1563756.1 glucosyltransferase [Clostridium sp.]